MVYQERFVDNQGVRIRYLDNAPDPVVGLPVLFVPGITDFADEYADALEVFGSRRILVIEMRGRGGSDAPPTGYTVADQSSDVEAVIADNALGRFHMMTFSRGTTPGLEVALHRPARVVTVSIGDYLPAEIALPTSFAEMMWSTRWRGRPMPERIARHVIEGIQAQAQSREMWTDLAALGVPVLVARGSEGGLVTDDHVDRYRQMVPDVEVVSIRGADHDLFRPSRSAYPEAVLDFISRRAPGS